MALNQSFLPEWKHETGVTRKVLERIPFDQASWKPHEKSMTLQRLAVHVAEIAGWVKETVLMDELDFSKGDFKPKEINSVEELLAYYDDLVAKSFVILNDVSDETLMQNWTMRNGDVIYFTMPKIAVLRTWVFNHLVHHRGQLSVYLRLLNIPVPSIYGPSADEQS